MLQGFKKNNYMFLQLIQINHSSSNLVHQT